MAYIQFPIASTRVGTDGRFNGYGYDPVTNSVVSYKRDIRGVCLDKRTSYTMNGWTIRHGEVVEHARKFPGVSPVSKVSVTKIPVSASGPAFPYVMFSKKNQASQYFFAGTTIAEAMERFARRGEVLDPAEVSVVNVDTGQIHKLVPTTVYKLV